MNQILAIAKAVCPEHVGDAPVEAFHPAVGLRPPGPRQAVLDAECFG
jgi:hypothetical protein